MSDGEKRAGLDEAEAEELRRLLAPLRATLPSLAEREDMERRVMEALDHQEDGTPTEEDLPLRFEAWAALSASLVGAGPAERLDALDARDLSLDDWRRCEEHYFRSLAADLEAGRVTRVDLYARLCGEAVTRRKALPYLYMKDEVAVAEAAPPTQVAPAPVTAPPVQEVATFQKAEGALAPLPPVVRAPEHLTGTARALELPAAIREELGKLPFVKAPAAPAAVPSGPAKTVPLRAADTDLTGTLPLGSDLSAYVRAALPFEQTNAGGEAPFPRMELNHYASFRAELALAPPEGREAVMRKYGVRGEPSRQALEEHWRKALAADPAQRAEFERLYAEYVAWLRRQGAGK